MAKSTVYAERGQAGDVSINMTPMIDVVFQLIIFFILASQLASQERAILELPSPEEAVAEREKKIKALKVIVNVLSKEAREYKKKAGEQIVPGELAWYQVGTEVLGKDGLDTEVFVRMTKIIKDGYKAAKEAGREKEFHVEIRADYRVGHPHVARVMEVAVAAGVEKVNFGASLGNPPEED